MQKINSSEDSFVINKIGLLNFWLYDEEEFEFYDGKLILRGTNGSGKSVTMQSFIPLLFDGDKRPQRLDSFGSSSRKLEDYLLDPNDPKRQENTGYLYMELYKKSTNQFLTIGLGLRARRGKGVEAWGFALKDNRRVGIDFLLYKKVLGKIPLTKKELISQLGANNEFAESMKDYKEMVNRLIFGFENLKLYDEFLDLLLKVRTPKLSNNYKPSILTEELGKVLQPLTDDELRPMTESIENMKKIKETLEQLESNKKAIDYILKYYNEYNKLSLCLKANDYLEASNRNIHNENELVEIEKNIKEMAIEKEALEKEQDNSATELEAYRHKQVQLNKSNVGSMTAELSDLRNVVNDLDNKIVDKNKLLEEKQDLEREKQSKYKDIINKKDLYQKGIDENVLLLNSMTDEIRFDVASFYIEEFYKNIDKAFDFNGFKNELLHYKNKLNVIFNRLNDLKNKEFRKDELRQRYDEVSKKIDDILKQVKEQEDLLSEKVGLIKEEIARVDDDNLELKLSDEARRNIFNYIDNYNFDAKNKINELVYHDYSYIKDNINNNMLNIKNKIEGFDKEISNLNKEIDDLKKAQDIEMIITESVKNNRHFLEEKGIPYIPFFKAIEFKDNIDIQDKLEEALLDMGLLDALIIPKRYKDQLFALISDDNKDKYIFATEKIQNNLTKYFDVSLEYKENASDIIGVLESIGLNEGNIYINEKGYYKNNVLTGTVTKSYHQKYIGVLARKKYKEQQIKNLSDKIGEIKDLKANSQRLLDNLNKRLDVLISEFNQFPKLDALDNYLNNIKGFHIHLEVLNKDKDGLYNQITEISNQIRLLNEEIKEMSKGIYLKLDVDIFKEALKALDKYCDIIGDLINIHNTYLNTLDSLYNYKLQIEEINNDIDNIRVDIREIELSLNTNTEKIKTLDDLLNTDKYRNIKEELLKCEEKLSTIPKIREDNARAISKLETSMEYKNQQLARLNKELFKHQTLLEVFKQIFIREYNLHYVYQEEIAGDLKKLGQRIIKENNYHKGMFLSKEFDKMNDAFNKNYTNLSDYAPKISNIFEVKDDDLIIYSNLEEDLFEEVKQVLNSAVRKDIVMMLRGRNVNLLMLDADVLESISLNKELIEEEDHNLFEEILVNNVGKIIRKKIYESKQWIDRINDLMESMVTSSGLSFSLTWKNKEATDVDEMDTKDIVDILTRDAALVKPEENQRFTTHFRAKIKKAEEIMKEEDRYFYNIIFKVLDYRDWFEFKLSFKRKGTDKRELTDREFSKFSGGEKGIAMYIPLFASVYAKYHSARSDALRIIALDEAFAGVDDANIRDTFRIINELDLGYMMTSQFLWGDYDTVPLVAISELYQPADSDVVIVFRYRWNGVVKELVEKGLLCN